MGAPDEGQSGCLLRREREVLELVARGIVPLDTGEDISSDNLSRLFTQGFTTRKNGHGGLQR
jgi:hypothetical protein